MYYYATIVRFDAGQYTDIIIYHHHHYRPVVCPLQDKVSPSNIGGLCYIPYPKANFVVIRGIYHKSQSIHANGGGSQTNGTHIYELDFVVADSPLSKSQWPPAGQRVKDWADCALADHFAIAMTTSLTDETRPLVLRGFGLSKTHVMGFHHYQREILI